ncbi:MAG: amidohydrolase family protein [Kofleriaceae bacterium]|nr:amidohydrolase family protein [Kofleriaceae bacterium]MBP6838372.1 amidohydrolase family protein [Kofleriaceae bacterium]
MPDPLGPDETFRFDRLEDLARLPWFDLDGDRLVVSDPTVGPIIDMHAHYALPALWPHRVDLNAPPAPGARTELLLPCCARHDLDVYANQNFGELGVKQLKRELVLGGATGRGKRKTHTTGNLARDCKDVGVVHSAILAIDIGLPSRSVGDTVAAARARSDTTPFGSVHPRRRRPKEKLEEQLHAGARGVKLHPQLQRFMPADPAAAAVYRLAGREQVPVLWHCGPVGIEPAAARKFVQIPGYEPPLAEHPDTTFVLGHAGALASGEAIALQRRYPNTYLEVSCISLRQLRQVIAEADPDRIVYGTDWPFYHHALALAKVLIATEGQPALRRKILHDNAARLLRL